MRSVLILANVPDLLTALLEITEEFATIASGRCDSIGLEVKTVKTVIV
jgi:hypothetical protein